MNSKLDYRYIARIKLRALTPLFVGTGDASLITDSLVFKDCYGLPMIPGTSLTGVLRHAVEDKEAEDTEKWSDIFGYTGDANDGGEGSRLIVSSAMFLLGSGMVVEDLKTEINDILLSKLNRLPVRQHVKITHKGVAEKGNLFDHEVLYKGARFIFEIELKGTEKDKKNWESLLGKIKSSDFRVGQGTRNGFGSLEVIGIYNKTFDLKVDDDFKEYLNYSSSFNSIEINENVTADKKEHPNYTLILTPDDFFIFSEGFGDQEVDNKPVEEEIMVYENGEIKFENRTLIPVTSIKGAIAHRVAYYYNRYHGNDKDYNKGRPVFSDEIFDRDETGNLDFSKYVGEENPAVLRLFGKKADSDNDLGKRGILMMNDLYYPISESKDEKNAIDNSKIFNHVAIDRFTGGAIDGALFSEKVSYKLNKKEEKIVININLSEPLKIDKELPDYDIKNALEETLKDICRGLLPLGGMTTKGFGMFTGRLLKDGIEIYSYEKTKEKV